MKEYLQAELKQINKPLGHLIMVGAGSGGLLNALHSLGARKIMAIEGTDSLYSALQRKAKKFNNVETVNKWVMPVGKPSQQVYFFNNPRFNSLIPANNLESHHQNVKLQECIEVGGLAIDELFESLTLKTEVANLLIMTCQGAEKFILDGIPPSLLQKFDLLVLDKGMQGTDQEIGAIKLDDYAFEKLPSWPSPKETFEYYRLSERQIHLQQLLVQYEQKEVATKEGFNELFSKVAKLKEQNKELEAAEKAQAERYNEELQGLKIDLARLSEANNSLEYHNNQLTSQLERVKSESEQLNSDNRKLEEEVGNLLSEVKSKAEQAESIQNDISNKDLELSEKAGLIERLEKRLSELETINQSIDAQRLKLEDKNTQLTEQIKQINSQRAKVEKLADTNAKLLIKMQDDIAGLRQQVASKNEQLKELTFLIEQLHRKLLQASKVYEQLKVKHPELDWERF
jgi:phage shock protein A